LPRVNGRSWNDRVANVKEGRDSNRNALEKKERERERAREGGGERERERERESRRLFTFTVHVCAVDIRAANNIVLLFIIVSVRGSQ